MWLGDSAGEAKPLLARIDLTPLIGVLASLLVLFALCVPTLSETRLDTPGCGGDWFKPLPRDYQVRLGADGSILVDDVKASREQFDLLVAASRHSSREPYFHVHISPQTHYQQFAALLETLSRNRVRYFGFES